MTDRNLRNRMGDKHEEDLVLWFGGRRSAGSGNQWRNPMDGRHNRFTDAFAFAWDGKSTLGLGHNLSRVMWTKAADQADGERPLIALRWYDTGALDVGLDLVVVSADDFIEMRYAAQKWAAHEAYLAEQAS